MHIYKTAGSQVMFRKRISTKFVKSFGFALLSASIISAIGIQDASAQLSSREGIELQNQILELKTQLSQMQSLNNSGDRSDNHRRKKSSDDSAENAAAESGLLTQLLTRVEHIEEQQRTMRGQLDDLSHQVETQMATMNKKIEDANFAASQGSGASNAKDTAAASASAGASAGTASVSASNTGGATLKDGRQALVNRDYQQAEDIARQILATPQSKNSVNANFLLAQSLAGQKKYREAAVTYFKTYKQSPSSPRAPEALLGVSASLIASNQKKEACEALQLMHSKYPNATAKVKKAAEELGKRGNCS
ncbi:MAG: tetratricopeptide repeat protein [Commensalibacter sp.]|nr:tetratricopeptide repeat protein [Commensalibacter sp.]